MCRVSCPAVLFIWMLPSFYSRSTLARRQPDCWLWTIWPQGLATLPVTKLMKTSDKATWAGSGWGRVRNPDFSMTRSGSRSEPLTLCLSVFRTIQCFVFHPHCDYLLWYLNILWKQKPVSLKLTYQFSMCFCVLVLILENWLKKKRKWIKEVSSWKVWSLEQLILF